MNYAITKERKNNMAFKRSKMKQTDYTTGGRDISNTAIPLYQENLTRIGDYLSDPTERQDMYYDKYYGANNVENNDAIRNYKRAMAQTTANNYSATSGGYSSSGQRAYDDNQKGWNDYLARLANQGITASYNMAKQDYQNMLGANTAFQNAYSLGEDYSKIDQYNDLVNQANNNWYSGVLNAVGQAGMSSGNPWGMAIGAALSTTGDMLGNNAGDLADSMFQKNWGTSTGSNSRDTQSSSTLGNAFSKGWEGVSTLVNDWKSDNKKYFPKWAGGKGIQANEVKG